MLYHFGKQSGFLVCVDLVDNVPILDVVQPAFAAYLVRMRRNAQAPCNNIVSCGFNLAEEVKQGRASVGFRRGLYFTIMGVVMKFAFANLLAVVRIICIPKGYVKCLAWLRGLGVFGGCGLCGRKYSGAVCGCSSFVSGAGEWAHLSAPAVFRRAARVFDRFADTRINIPIAGGCQSGIADAPASGDNCRAGGVSISSPDVTPLAPSVRASLVSPSVVKIPCDDVARAARLIAVDSWICGYPWSRDALGDAVLLGSVLVAWSVPVPVVAARLSLDSVRRALCLASYLGSGWLFDGAPWSRRQLETASRIGSGGVAVSSRVPA